VTDSPLIALIEDEEHLAQGLLYNLQAEGYRTHHESDGDAALAWLLAATAPGADAEVPAVIVLDCMLPGADGFAIARALREAQRYTPILMLTARSRPQDILEGLEAGADDYLPKPFDFTELVARIQALARRPGARPPSGLGYRDLGMDPARRIATRGGRRLPLTPKEFAVLQCLLKADGRPVPARELLQRVWDEAADPVTTTVKTTIGRLRAKLGDPPVIETVRDGGYRIGGS
jgi:DNA-binding response OmpR family regulator